MFPYRDHNPSTRTPFVTYTLLGLNIVIFFLSMMAEPAWLYTHFALVPMWVSEGESLSGIFTSMFLHGGYMHLIGNMLFLWVFGDNIEDTMGHVLFLLFYLACGAAAGLFHVVLDPTSNVPLIGASGAIAGVLGGYWLLFPRARVDVLVILVIYIRSFAIPAFWVLLAWFGLQIFMGFTTSSAGGGVAYWAHFGGFVAGLALTLPFWLKRGARQYWLQNNGHPPHPPTTVHRVGTMPKISRKP